MKRSECKELAKSIIKGKWIIAFASILIVTAISVAIATVTAGIGIWLLSASLTIALFNVFIKGYKENKYEISDMVKGATDNITNKIVLSLLKYVYLILWGFLFMIPAIIKTYSYALAELIARNEPELSGNDCITKSRKLMDGHKMELFIFDLSFMGWFILGSLTFGIALIWILPYYMQARIIFIDKNIYKVEKEKPLLVDTEF